MRGLTFGAVHTYRGRPYSAPLLPRLSVLDWLEEHARARPDAPFITEERAGKIGASHTYGDVHRAARGAAARLRRAGVGPGDPVGVLPRNDAASVVAILAVLGAGAVAVIVNPHEPAGRVQEQLAAARCALTIAADRFLEKAAGAARSSEALARDAGADDGAPPLERSGPEDGAIVMFTTGTTASSKAILQTHYNVVVNGAALVRRHRMDAATRLLCTLPIHYANGLDFTILASMMAGSHVLLSAEFDPLSYLRVAADHRVQIASLVPSLLASVVEARRAPDLDALRYFVSAAAPLPQALAVRVLERLRKRVVQGYGLTETTNFSTLLPTDLGEAAYRRWMIDAEIPSIGTEVFGNEVVVLGPDAAPADDGQEGEIAVRGHNVMWGYLGNPEATAEAFRGGWFHTGDLGRIRADPATGERYVTITGRLKNMIKVSGQALSLDELDRAVASIDGVVEAASCGIPDPRTGEAAALVVVRSDPSVTEQAIDASLRRHFGEHGLPRRVAFADAIPRSLNGKINRRLLVERFFPQR